MFSVLFCKDLFFFMLCQKNVQLMMTPLDPVYNFNLNLSSWFDSSAEYFHTRSIKCNSFDVSHLDCVTDGVENVWNNGMIPEVSEPGQHIIWAHRTWHEQPWTYQTTVPSYHISWLSHAPALCSQNCTAEHQSLNGWQWGFLTRVLKKGWGRRCQKWGPVDEWGRTGLSPSPAE